MTDHALLSPSSAARWLNCPGSVRLTKNLPNATSEYAQLGRFAHTIAEIALTETDGDVHLAGLRASNRFACEYGEVPEHEPDDINGAVQKYLDYVSTLPGEVFVEQKIDLTRWVPGGFGTADYVAVSDEALHVVDYKNGTGVPVSPVENEQAMCYAVGVVDALEMLYEFEAVVIHIVQPRAFAEPSVWETTKTDLLKWADETLAPGAAIALTEEGGLYPGDKQCRWCAAQASCPELASQALDAAMDGFELIVPELRLKDVEALDLDQVGLLCQWSKPIKSWLEALERRAYNELKLGNHVPGWKRVYGNKPARRWADEKKAQRELNRLAKENGTKAADVKVPSKPISPTKAEALFGKDLFSESLAELVTQGDPKPTLAPASDSRPAIVVEDPTKGLEDLTKN